MEIIFFILFFIVIGFIIGVTVKNNTMAVWVIVAISVIWAIVSGPWAIATLIELLLGFGLAKEINKNN